MSGARKKVQKVECSNFCQVRKYMSGDKFWGEREAIDRVLSLMGLEVCGKSLQMSVA